MKKLLVNSAIISGIITIIYFLIAAFMFFANVIDPLSENKLLLTLSTLLTMPTINAFAWGFGEDFPMYLSYLIQFPVYWLFFFIIVFVSRRFS